MVPCRAGAADDLEVRLLDQIDGLEPADRVGGGLVGHARLHSDGAITQSELAKGSALRAILWKAGSSEASTRATSNGDVAAVRMLCVRVPVRAQPGPS